MNNSMWVLDKLIEWLEKGIISVEGLRNKTQNNEEKIRLSSKYSTLKMVLDKIYELKNE